MGLNRLLLALAVRGHAMAALHRCRILRESGGPAAVAGNGPVQQHLPPTQRYVSGRDGAYGEAGRPRRPVLWTICGV